MASAKKKPNGRSMMGNANCELTHFFAIDWWSRPPQLPVGPAVRIFAAGPIPPHRRVFAESESRYVGCARAEADSVIGRTHEAVLYATLKSRSEEHTSEL